MLHNCSKFFVLAFLLMFSQEGIAQNRNEVQYPEGLVRIKKFGRNRGNLKMFIHPCAACNDSLKHPLVVVLHGCSQTASSVANLSGWNKLADLNRFTVLYPQQKLSNNVSLCFNWFRKHDINKGRGESESIYSMVQFLVKNYAVDRSLIYVTGLSAGAAMGVAMMATHPETFQGGAIYAGGAYKMATNIFSALGALLGKSDVATDELVKNVVEQNPGYNGKYPLMVIYQGQNDPVVNKENATALIRQWTALQHSDMKTDKTEKLFQNIPDITRFEYQNEQGETIVIYYAIDHLGHQLLVNPGNAENEGGKTGMFAVDKDFHSTYQIGVDFGLIKKK